MEAIFTVYAKGGKAIQRNQEDYYDYMIENEGEALMMILKPMAKVAEKERMFAFLHGPLMACAVLGYANAGEEGIDKVKARFRLQAEFAKEDTYNHKTGKITSDMISLKKMTKTRLYKFIEDCVFYIENNLGQRTPDSSLYKMQQLTGRDFSSTKFQKE